MGILILHTLFLHNTRCHVRNNAQFSLRRLRHIYAHIFLIVDSIDVCFPFSRTLRNPPYARVKRIRIPCKIV